VPWSTALGCHEKFIAQRIYGLNHLTDQEQYLLHFCFRGSSYVSAHTMHKRKCKNQVLENNLNRTYTTKVFSQLAWLRRLYF